MLLSVPAVAQEILQVEAPVLVAPAAPNRLITVQRPKILRSTAADTAWLRSTDSYPTVDAAEALLRSSQELLEYDLQAIERTPDLDDTVEKAEARYQERFRRAVEKLADAVKHTLADGSVGNNTSRYAPTSGAAATPPSASKGPAPASGAGWKGALGRE